MDVLVPARELVKVLKGFKPRARTRPFAESCVRATAGGGMLIIFGSFENSASLPVEVKSPGSVNLPLDATIRLLSTFKGKQAVQIRSDAHALWLGPVRLPFRGAPAKSKVKAS